MDTTGEDATGEDTVGGREPTPDGPALDILLPDDGRHESLAQRYDRNWSELLQELRVTQTGVQLLAGFLLTLPFQQRFQDISETDRKIYLAAFALAIVATALLIAPVSAHRLLFRRRLKGRLVALANVCALAGLGVLAAAVTMVAFLIFDVVEGRGPAFAAAGAAAFTFVATWLVLPRWRLGSGSGY